MTSGQPATIPAHLIVGSPEQTLVFVEALLQKKLCPLAAGQPGCFCSTCRKIKAHQHHSAVWIFPEKGYTVDDVNIIFERTALALDEHENCFFILEKAQTLTSATANRILKVLEEPPCGYHFILLTDNLNALLPTIISRSMVTILEQGMGQATTNPLLTFFSPESTKRDSFGFEQELKKQHLSDGQSCDLVYELINQYSQRIKIVHEGHTYQHLSVTLEFLLKQAKKLPQSGSSELFWKNMYLSWPLKK